MSRSIIVRGAMCIQGLLLLLKGVYFFKNNVCDAFMLAVPHSQVREHYQGHPSSSSLLLLRAQSAKIEGKGTQQSMIHDKMIKSGHASRSSIKKTSRKRLSSSLRKKTLRRSRSNSPSLMEQVKAYEVRFMQRVQQITLPGFKTFSTAIHYSLLPQVMAPIFAVMAWMVSLPTAGSLICFLNAQDVLNSAIKWSIQRPRPMWCTHSNTKLLEVKSSTSVASWEADYSFPSAHTQFFAGLAFCAFSMGMRRMVEPPVATIRIVLSLIAILIGATIGLTRNYLAVHWPTDTTFGFLLGALLGSAWGYYDPYAWLMKQGSPTLSLGVAFGVTTGLCLLLLLAKSISPPIQQETLQRWGNNWSSYMNTSAENNKENGENQSENQQQPLFLPKERDITTKIAMLSTVFFSLAYTSLYSLHLPSALMEPGELMRDKIVQTLVGLGGMSGTIAFMKKTFSSGIPTMIQRSAFAKTTLKAAAYAGICAWTLLLTQLTSHHLLYLFG